VLGPRTGQVRLGPPGGEILGHRGGEVGVPTSDLLRHHALGNASITF
jgi:hypothetical protein